MKSVVINNQKEIKYPCVMKGKNTGVIVLFEKDGVGTVVHSVEGYPVAYHSIDWQMVQFQPFDGAIKLSND